MLALRAILAVQPEAVFIQSEASQYYANWQPALPTDGYYLDIPNPFDSRS